MPDSRYPALLLRQIVYFKTAPDPAIEYLSAHCQRHVFSSNTPVFDEGVSDSRLWMVSKGHVRLYKISPGGEEFTLILVGENGTFNDVAAFDNGITPGYASTLNDVVAYTVAQSVLMHVIRHYPDVAQQVTQSLAARVRMQFERLEELSLYDVTTRLARFLLRQLSNPQLSGPGVTRIAIAAHLATTPQTISNALKILEQAGTIQYDRQHVRIVDEAALRSLAQL